MPCVWPTILCHFTSNMHWGASIQFKTILWRELISAIFKCRITLFIYYFFGHYQQRVTICDECRLTFVLTAFPSRSALTSNDCRHLSIFCSSFLPLNNTPRYMNSANWSKSPNAEWAIHPFLAKDHCPTLGSAYSYLSYLTFSCGSSRSHSWWRKQDQIIHKKERRDHFIFISILFI